MIALHPLARTETQVHFTNSREEGRKGAHILGRCAAAAEACRDTGVAGLVGEAFGVDLLYLVRDGVERLVPTDGNKARILVSALHRVSPLHRRLDAVGIVGLLH